MTDEPLTKLTAIKKLKGKELIAAKHDLALILTSKVHGVKGATIAKNQAIAAFSNDDKNMPEKALNLTDLGDQSVVSLLIAVGLCPSKSAAKRLINDGGVVINGTKVVDVNAMLDKKVLQAKTFILHKGKKQH